eukprot:2468826-Rhodomonas_salina.2
MVAGAGCGEHGSSSQISAAAIQVSGAEWSRAGGVVVAGQEASMDEGFIQRQDMYNARGGSTSTPI